jgi:hypothetical protein
MITGRFAAAEGRGAPLAEGLGADSNLLYFLGFRNCIVRSSIAHSFFCVTGYDVASMELQKVQDITSFIFFCVREDDVASNEVQEVCVISSFHMRAMRILGIIEGA